MIGGVQAYHAFMQHGANVLTVVKDVVLADHASITVLTKVETQMLCV